MPALSLILAETIAEWKFSFEISCDSVFTSTCGIRPRSSKWGVLGPVAEDFATGGGALLCPLKDPGGAPGLDGADREFAPSKDRIAQTPIKPAVIAGNGFDSSRNHAAFGCHNQGSPGGWRLLAPVRRLDARDFIQRGFLWVESKLEEVSGRSAQ